MPDKFELDMMYRIELPEGTDELLSAEFEEGDELTAAHTELLSEVWTTHVLAVETLTGYELTSNWVYLTENSELWSSGWYLVEALPEGWEGTTEEILRRLWSQRGNHVRFVLYGVKSKFINMCYEEAED